MVIKTLNRVPRALTPITAEVALPRERASARSSSVSFWAPPTLWSLCSASVSVDLAVFRVNGVVEELFCPLPVLLNRCPLGGTEQDKVPWVRIVAGVIVVGLGRKLEGAPCGGVLFDRQESGLEPDQAVHTKRIRRHLFPEHAERLQAVGAMAAAGRRRRNSTLGLIFLGRSFKMFIREGLLIILPVVAWVSCRVVRVVSCCVVRVVSCCVVR